MFKRSRFSWGSALAATALVVPSVQAQALAQFDLPAQSLAASLRAVGSQTSTNILFDPPLVEGWNAPALKANLTAEQAFVRLLAGTGLKLRFLDDKTAMVISAADGRDAERSLDNKAPGAALGAPAAVQGEAGDVAGQRVHLAQADGNEGAEARSPERGGDGNAAKGQTLEEIVVTAERRQEYAQDVPIAMSVFSGDFIKQYISDPYEVADLTPNYQINAVLGLTGSNATIRGLGSSDRSASIAATSILTYYDGIAAGTPFTATLPQWDLARIEVQRGPQGTLYGRNAVGGTVQYISAAPTDTLEGYGEYTLGEFDLKRFEGAISGPLGETINARISALVYDRGGDVAAPTLDSELGEKEWWGVKGIVDWQISDKLSARVKAQHFEGDTDSLFFNAAPSDNFSPGVLAWLSAAGVDPDLERESNFERTQAGLPDPFEEVDVDLLELDLNYDLGSMALAVVGGYLGGDNTMANGGVYPAPLLVQRIVGDISQRSAEVRLTSQSDNALQWIVGAYYQETDDSSGSYLDQTADSRDLDGDGRTRHNADSPEDLLDGIIPNRALVGATNLFLEGAINDQHMQTQAFFVHTTYDWTDRFTTTHAVRYTSEEKEVGYSSGSSFEFPVSGGVVPGTWAQYDDFVSFAQLNHAERRQRALSIISDPNLLDANGNVVLRSVSDKWTEVTWRLAADYHLTPDALLYASVSKGFKGGIFTTNRFADPETSIVYEVGGKTEWLNNRLRVNVSGFYNDHSDFQTLLQDLITGVRVVENLPKSKIYGGEIEIQAVPIDNLTLIANVGVLESEITGVTASNEALLGNVLPLAEDTNFSGLVRYDLRFAIGTISPQVSWRYRGDYWSSKENNDIQGSLGNFWTTDLRLGYESTDRKLYALLYCKNLLNEVQAIYSSQPAPPRGTTFSKVNERRNWGVTVGFRF